MSSVGDLSDLFGAVDGFVDDAIEFGVLSGTAVATGVAFTMGANFVINKFLPTAPAWVRTYAVPGAAVALGVVGGGYVANAFNRRVGMGIGIGLMTAGINMAIRNFFPTLPLAGVDGLGYAQDEALLGLGENLYDRYLSGAPTTIEPASGLSYATTVEEASPGVGNFQVEAVNGYPGLGSYGVSPGFAAVLS